MSILQKMKAWIDLHPESYHDFDKERWFSLIETSIEMNEPLDFNEIEIYIRENKQWTSDFIKEFIDKKESEYTLITSFMSFLTQR